MSKMNMAQAINSALKIELERDPSVFLLGIDVGGSNGVFGVTQGLQAQFGEKRVKDTPISESAFIGASVGAAVAGLRPVAEIEFVDFIGVAMDQILNQAAKMRYMFGGRAKVPMVLRAPSGAGISAGAQHSQSLESWFMHIPGIKCVLPSNPYDAKGLMISAIRDNNPVIFLEHKVLYSAVGEVPEEEYAIPMGKSEVKQTGNDITIVATGQMVQRAMDAARKLAEDGLSIEVIDPRTILPLDIETILQSVIKTHRLLIVSEEVKFGGSGAEIAAAVAENVFDYLEAPIVRLGGPFTPIPFSSVLEAEFIPSVEKITTAAIKMMEG